MMARYIDADKKIEEINMRIESTTKLIESRPYDEEAKLILREHNFCLKELKNTPTADVVEVKHGKWRGKTNIVGYFSFLSFECSNCKNEAAKPYNYCANCGAKMDGGKE